MDQGVLVCRGAGNDVVAEIIRLAMRWYDQQPDCPGEGSSDRRTEPKRIPDGPVPCPIAIDKCRVKATAVSGIKSLGDQLHADVHAVAGIHREDMNGRPPGGS